MNNKKIRIEQENNILRITFCDNFLSYDNKGAQNWLQSIDFKSISKIIFATENVEKWDSSLVILLFDAIKEAKKYSIVYDISSLEKNLQELLVLAFSVDRKPPADKQQKEDVFETLGKNTFTIAKKISNALSFIKSVCGAIMRFFGFSSIMRSTDFWAALNDCGPKALGIVSLISFLVGLILAFVGAVQLKEFGAQIYVASLVTIGMCRIMGAIMVGIIMAGRTGSAYAATIGTMQVNEELDALETMGLSKIDFLVLPRIFSLTLSMPILTMLADFMGIIGGAFVGVFMLNIPYQEYYRYALRAFSLNNFLVGIFHGLCFGIIIALCGCYQGLNCGRNADSVGVCTTKSVVSAVVFMIIATGIITVICQEIGI